MGETHFIIIIISICSKFKYRYVSWYYSAGNCKHKIATWTSLVLYQTHIFPACSVIYMAACVCSFLTVKERPEVLVVSFHQPLNGGRQNLSFLHFCVEHRALQQPEKKESERKKARGKGEIWIIFYFSSRCAFTRWIPPHGHLAIQYLWGVDWVPSQILKTHAEWKKRQEIKMETWNRKMGMAEEKNKKCIF